MVISLLGLGSALQINEIMYDPQYNENYNEWVEIYNDDSYALDLSNYTLCGRPLLAGHVDRAEVVQEENGFVLEPGAYALVTDGGSGSEVYDNYNVVQSLALHVDAASICGGLANDGDTITIEHNNETLEEVIYAPDADPGFSLEWRENAFYPSASIDGTPGGENTQGQQNNSNNDPPANESEDPPEKRRERNRTQTLPEQSPTPSFVPLYDEAPERGEAKEQKTKITLSAPRSETKIATAYVTPEARMRQTVIYSFAGFCIVLTLLIVLKRV